MHTNNRQPKSMYALSENSITFKRFFSSKKSSVKGLGMMTSISSIFKLLKFVWVKINLHVADLIK